MDLGTRIRRAREAAGLKQEDLAHKLGVTTRTIGNWERGRVPRNALGALQQILRIQLDEHDTSDQPRLDQATDSELLTTLAARLADRDRRIADLETRLAEREDTHG